MSTSHPVPPFNLQPQGLTPWYQSATCNPSSITLPACEFEHGSESVDAKYATSAGHTAHASSHERPPASAAHVASAMKTASGWQQSKEPTKGWKGITEAVPPAYLYNSFDRQAKHQIEFEESPLVSNGAPDSAIKADRTSVSAKHAPGPASPVHPASFDAIPNQLAHGQVIATSCMCLACVGLGVSSLSDWGKHFLCCRFPGCNSTFDEDKNKSDKRLPRLWALGMRTKHEKRHFGASGRYSCIQPQCVFKDKSWAVRSSIATAKETRLLNVLTIFEPMLTKCTGERPELGRAGQTRRGSWPGSTHMNRDPRFPQIERGLIKWLIRLLGY